MSQTTTSEPTLIEMPPALAATVPTLVDGVVQLLRSLGDHLGERDRLSVLRTIHGEVEQTTTGEQMGADEILNELVDYLERERTEALGSWLLRSVATIVGEVENANSASTVNWWLARSDTDR